MLFRSFPVNWSPRYVAAMGLSANVDRNEDFKVRPEYRSAAVRANGTYYANRTFTPNALLSATLANLCVS